jgi:predicted RNA-binding Zn ribbon-like protein
MFKGYQPFSMFHAIQDRPFELIAGHPALDLVNTLDWRFRDNGPEELLPSYDDLLRFTAQSELLTAKQIRQIDRTATESAAAAALVACRELREAAADVLYAAVDDRTPAASQIKTLERFFKEAREHQRLAWSGSRLVWEWPVSECDAELPLWMLSLSTARLLTSDDMGRLRACEKPDCRWLFLDTSKNHTRRWCDMKICGNRMKARRFKAMHSA